MQELGLFQWKAIQKVVNTCTSILHHIPIYLFTK